MHLRPLRRALTLALAGALAFAGVASADIVRADGDILTPATDSFVDLGDVAPSAELTVTVGFTLVCSGLSHPDAGQTIQLGFLTGSQPLDGQIVSVGDATLGPVPASWTDDGEGCPNPVPSVATGGTSTVTLRAPSVPGNGYAFSIDVVPCVEPRRVGGRQRLRTHVDLGDVRRERRVEYAARRPRT